MKQVAIFLADGFEEIEALTPADILRRSGFDVYLVGIHESIVTGSHHIGVQADLLLSEAAHKQFDALILPGGMPGARLLKESQPLLRLIQHHRKNGKLIAAICAAPIVLEAAGIMNHQRFTCYPGFEQEISNGVYTHQFVEVDQAIITACGPAAAFEFSYEIVRQLNGNDEKIRNEMQYNRLRDE